MKGEKPLVLRKFYLQPIYIIFPINFHIIPEIVEQMNINPFLICSLRFSNVGAKPYCTVLSGEKDVHKSKLFSCSPGFWQTHNFSSSN